MILVQKHRGVKPILYWGDSLLVSRGPDLFSVDLELKHFKKLGSLVNGFITRILYKNRFVSRVFRLEYGPACVIGNGGICLIHHRGSVFRLNLFSGETEPELMLGSGRKILNLTHVADSRDFGGVYFGEYFDNPEMTAVRVYHRNHLGRWSVVYTFAPGQINHIHNIVEDRDSDCFYILTGDFGEGAAIWKADRFFKKIERIGKSGQNYRACWMHVNNDALLYATDSQFEDNAINIIRKTNDGYSLPKCLHDIPGSSIYHLTLDCGCLVFSTAVEPGISTSNRWVSLFSRARGQGIKTDKAFIFAMDIDGRKRRVFEGRKDCLPYRLFQFGSFLFPSGICSSKHIFHAYGVALHKYDNCVLVFKTTTMDGAS